MKNPIVDFQVQPSDLKYIGKDLQRPECILAEKDGTLWISDARGGIVKIPSDKEQIIIKQSYFKAFAKDNMFIKRSIPNGLAFNENGDILIANFGNNSLEKMTRYGATKIVCRDIHGKFLGKVNFVLRDKKNRLFLSISTRINKWWEALSPNIADGYVALIDSKGIRIVAEGFRFTNEIRLDEKEEYLYVAETAGQCISRLKVSKNGSLSNREIFGPTKLGKAGFPDGIAFDSYGNLWGTLVMTDQIFVLTPEGDFHIVLNNKINDAALSFERAFIEDRITPNEIEKIGNSLKYCFSSVTFGNFDLRTVYIGSVKGTHIPYFQSPTSGLPMVHWK